MRWWQSILFIIIINNNTHQICSDLNSYIKITLISLFSFSFLWESWAVGGSSLRPSFVFLTIFFRCRIFIYQLTFNWYKKDSEKLDSYVLSFLCYRFLYLLIWFIIVFYGDCIYMIRQVRLPLFCRVQNRATAWWAHYIKHKIQLAVLVPVNSKGHWLINIDTI